MTSAPFPSLADNWEPTRATLHAYSKAIGALPQTHVPKHDKWWHISLNARPDGLTTENMALPDGGVLNARLDFRTHEVVMRSSSGWEQRFSFKDGRSGTEMAEAVIEAAATQGLTGEYVRKDFEDNEAGAYDPSVVPPFWTALMNASAVFETHRSSLDSDAVGPVQFWPHGFDLAFEWFGTKKVSYHYEELPSQLNLGFYSSGDAPYFYSNPFPFDGTTLMETELPHGDWYTEPFQGSTLLYSDVADRPDGAEILASYAKAVYEVSRPTLMA